MARILVVDDDPDIVDLITDMLKPEHDVIGTTEPEAALHRLAENDIQLLVTDVRMPTMSGFQLVDQARRHRPDINVLLISAYYDDSDPVCQDVFRHYATMALPKPLGRRSVQTMVEWCLLR